MASNAITQPERRYLPSTFDSLSGAPSSQSSQAVPPLPTLLVTSPWGYVHEILRPARRTAARLSPATIRRLQAARYAESPQATASSLLNEQEEHVAEAPGAATFGASLNRSAFTHSPFRSIEAMDEFAQTRAPDDLFDDDFTPLSGSTPQPAPQTSHHARGDYQRGRGERGGRGRGRGRAEVSAEATREGQEPNESIEAVKESVREPAVRGDRSGTGGLKKPKLSEDELSARMEAVKLNNVKREAAHARAEADEASFQQREQVAHYKRLEERQNRRVMDGERERNRLRKLKAVGGREWDAEKNEDDFVEPRGQSSQYRRGAHGGVAFNGESGGRRDDDAGRPYANPDFDSRGGDYVPKGPRGGGGRGRGRGRGRGGFNGQTSRDDNSASHPPVGETELPALPSGGKGEKEAKGEKDGVGSSSWATPQATDSFQSPVGEKLSWADQLESTVPTPPGGW